MGGVAKIIRDSHINREFRVCLFEHLLEQNNCKFDTKNKLKSIDSWNMMSVARTSNGPKQSREREFGLFK